MRLRNVLTMIALAGSAPAFAQSVEVTSSGLSFPTLTEAMAAAVVGDTLIVSAGTYAEDLVIDKDLTIEGVGADLVTLTGNVAASIILVNLDIDLTVSGVTFDASGRRAIRTVNGSVVTIDDVVFNTSAALDSGGALSLTGSDLTVSNSTFVGRGGAALGGAIYATGLAGDAVDVSNSTFAMGGFGGTKGGAIYAVGVPVVCTDCWITDAVASDEGGAIYTTSSLTLLGGAISGSSASDGGAVYVGGGSLTVDGTSFTGNTAVLDGGAIALVTPTAVGIGGAHFCGNSAVFGGAIYGTATTASQLHNSIFVENVSTTGGALYLAGAGSWTLENTSVLGNESPGYGAIHIASTTVTVVSSLFAHNTGYALSRGGGIEPIVEYAAFYLNSEGDLDNVALDGGEILGLDPRLFSYTNDGDCTNDDLWPSPWSPLVDMGDPDPAYDDPDGSPNDIGAYGGPLADPSRHLVDTDADGASLVQDCDDTVGTTFPGADEVCNLVDDDCDELIDEDAIDAITWHADADGDGYGDWSPGGTFQCFAPLGHVADYTDCNDQDAGVNPGVDETCAGGDLNCDGDDFLDALDATTWTFDDDLDGHGDILSATEACASPGPDYLELDGTDCDDTRADVHPDMPEVCNGMDDNCTGGEDDASDVSAWYLDADQDTFGDAGSVAVYACDPPPDASADNTDCDDGQSTVFPGNAETCDGLDNDCNDAIDDGGEASTWLPDVDGDGFGADGLSVESFCAPEASGWIQGDGGDCDDTDPSVYDGAAEQCDGVDNDCDGKTDDADEDVEGTQAWVDFDGDGYGDGEPEVVCDSTGYATEDGDCNDVDPEMNPDAVDVPGNDLDEDCDGRPLDSDETGAGPPADEPGGCGCSHSAPSTGWMIPLLGLALARRRSR